MGFKTRRTGAGAAGSGIAGRCAARGKKKLGGDDALSADGWCGHHGRDERWHGAQVLAEMVGCALLTRRASPSIAQTPCRFNGRLRHDMIGSFLTNTHSGAVSAARVTGHKWSQLLENLSSFLIQEHKFEHCNITLDGLRLLGNRKEREHQMGHM